MCFLRPRLELIDWRCLKYTLNGSSPLHIAAALTLKEKSTHNPSGQPDPYSLWQLLLCRTND